MRISKYLISLFLLLIITFCFSSLSFATGEESNISISVNEEISIRKEFGLETSIEILSQLADIPKDKHYGFRLTEEELQELQEREAFSDKNIPNILLELRGENFNSKIGTFYRDNQDGGKLIIGLVSSNKNKNEIIERIKEKVPIHAQSKIKFLEVTYSEDDLDKMIQKIFSEEELLKEQGIYLTEAFEDIKENKVTVGIYPYSQEAEAIIKARYGTDLVNVVEKEIRKTESRLADYYYMYGGIRIAGTASNSIGNSGGCSAGFSIANASGYFLVTAGHCTRNWSSFYQGGYYKGSVYATKEGGSADVGIIKLSGNRTTNDIYRYSYGDRALTSYQGVTDDYVGQYVEKVGTNTGRTQGAIQSRNWHGNLVNPDGSKVYYTYLRDASYSSTGGDSGGTVYWGNQLRGIHSGANGLFSHIYYVNQKTPGLPKLN